MRTTKRLFALLAAIGLLATTAGLTLAFDSPGSPASTGPDTITWTGQGVTNGAVDPLCDAQKTPYLLWVLTTDHGSAENVTLHVNGSDYSADTTQGNNFHFVTPYLDPATITASADFTVVDTGDGGWNLVISHGCSGGPRPDASDPQITKDAGQSYDFEYAWTISKAVNTTEIDPTPGGTATFNYTVTLNHDAGSNTNISDVTGNITVTNSNNGPITLDSITDVLSDGTTCAVDTSGGLTVAPGPTIFPYTCGLSAFPGDYPNTKNRATMTWSQQDLSDGSTLKTGSTFFEVPVIFKKTVTDNCATVTDPNSPNPPLPATVCVGDSGDISGTFTFTYSHTFDAPALGTCASYKNTASFIDNSDPVNDGSASQTVKVCTYNAPLTPGYWKNHAANSKSSGAFYSSLCSKLKNSSCSTNGVWAIQYLPQTLGGYSVATIQDADGVWGLMNCSSSTDQGAVGCLAGHLLAAKLNVANVANPCISTTIGSADAFLSTVGYTGPTWKGILSPAQRTLAISLKSALDKYNNGGGC